MLHIDIETYGSADLSKTGTYRYAANDDFEVILFAYAYDDEPVQIVDLLSGEKVPERVIQDLTDPTVIKVAHNAAFERICLSRFLELDGYLDPSQWICTMVWAYYCGLPGSLKNAGAALNVDKKKMTEEGKYGITYFCKPYKGVRKYPQDHPEGWAKFKAYCLRDVETEREIYEKLQQYQSLPPREWELWYLDQKINDRGFGVDLELLNSVREVQIQNENRLREKAREIDPDLNVNATAQVLTWLQDHGFDMANLRKETVDAALENTQGDVREVLQIRRELSKAAIKKFKVFEQANVDGRIHGTLQFYGAFTGRWSGRLVQPQNMARPVYYEIDSIRQLTKEVDLPGLSKKFSSVNDALSSILRTVIISQNKSNFAVADYSAIECRVVAWVAGEKWVLDAFHEGKDIYCQTASMMFHVPVEKHGQNAHLRSKGKIATLACGYGGSIGALRAFGADKTMTDQEMADVVAMWRSANPNIVELWKSTEQAAKKAIQTGGRFQVNGKITYSSKVVDGNTILFCELPSGRRLEYNKVSIDSTGQILYETSSGAKGIYTTKTWGGKLVENIVQAIARDCLASALLRLEAAGFETVFHVHDEVIVEVDEPQDLEKICQIMGKPIPDLPGLELKAEGYTGPYYKKE